MLLSLLAQIVELNAVTIATAVLLLVLLASLVFWRVMLGRYLVGKPVLQRERRRRVPWHGLEVMVVVAAHLVFTTLAVSSVHNLLEPELVEPLPEQAGADPDTSHTVLRTVATGDPWVLALALFAVVIVAPVVEEFLFRVLLQGWLEACMERWAVFVPRLRPMLPGAWGPIFASSFLFAGAHFHGAGPQHHSEYLIALMLANTAASVLSLGFALVFLRLRVEATAADFGVVLPNLAGDVRLGMVWLMGLLGPIYVVQAVCHAILPKTIAPDPIPLFLFALGLGFLYARTHRIVPCIVLHAGLNAASLALAWVAL